MEHEGYSGTVEYSIEDDCYHGQIEFIEDIITYESDCLEDIETAFQEAVERYLDYLDDERYFDYLLVWLTKSNK